MKRLVMGIGTGRCGTVSLARLLNNQKDTQITHEAKPLIPWDKRQIKGYEFHKKRFKKALKQYNWTGDVASYWLPYLDNLFEDFDEVKIIALWRDKEQVVKSFMKKTEGLNHWMTHAGIRWRPNPFDFCYPTYDVNSKKKALGKYWEDYQKLLKKEKEKRPDNILILNVEKLNSEKGQDKIFNFLGIKEHQHLLPCKFNVAKKIWISILNQGEMRPELNNVLLRMGDDGRFAIHINYPNRKPEMSNRNAIVKEFLETDYDYLLMIDSDIVPLKNPLDLVELDKDIINFVAPQWREEDLYWVAMDRVKDGWKPIPPERRKGLKQVDATGQACILIKREVFEKMNSPYFKHKFNKEGIHGEGMEFDFCKRAKKKGFKVWVHWGYPCSHFKKVDLFKVLRLLGKKYG